MAASQPRQLTDMCQRSRATRGACNDAWHAPYRPTRTTGGMGRCVAVNHLRVIQLVPSRL